MSRLVVEALTRTCTEISIPRSGVYFLFLGEELLYVGQTASLDARLQIHAKYIEFDRVLWRAVPSEDLNRWEGALIRALLPPLNRRAPTYQGDDNAVLAAIGLPTHEHEPEAVQAADAVLRSRQAYTRTEDRYRLPRQRRARRNAERRSRLRRSLWCAVRPLLSTESA